MIMVKPSRPDRHIAFGRHPDVAVGMSRCKLLIVGIACINHAFAQERPVGCVGKSFFVAHPSAARPAIGEDHCLWLKLFYHGVGTVKVVVSAAVYGARFLCSAVVTVAPVGPVEPNFKNFSVVCEQLAQLVVVVIHVGGRAIGGLMP